MRDATMAAAHAFQANRAVGIGEHDVARVMGRALFEWHICQHVQQPLVQMMVDELLGRGTCPSTGESGARTAWVMDQMVADWRRESGVAF